MKTIILAFGILLMASCNGSGSNKKTTDSVTINTTETPKADGGPNNGLGDTSTIDRTKDTITHDTSNKR